jgi:corrinoid protein of di/trimethylamine methyltransferase
MRTKEELLKKLSDAVFEMEDEALVAAAANEYIKAGYDAREGMLSGLVDGMKRASELYESGEYYVPELIVCSDAMYAGIEEFQKHLPKEDKAGIGKIVIGVVEGDTHDIGKNLVRIMLETGGFDVHDLGRDVPLDRFVEYAKEHSVNIVCMSSLMTTTMPGMETVIKKLEDAGVRDTVKVMIGGAPVSSGFAEKIGADGYSRNAVEAVRLAQELIGAA